MSLLSILLGRRPGDAPPRGAGATPGEGAGGEAARHEPVRRAASLLSDLTVEESRELVWGVSRRFLAHVADLPASERYHHAGPFGLYDHSVEVAEGALRASLSEYFVADTRAYPEEQEHRVPRLRYAAWFLGILHDSGKIAQVVVQAPGAPAWNPYVDPLGEYYRRHGRERCALSWKTGRGLDAHTWHNAYLLGRFLSGPVATYLGPRLTSELLAQETEASRKVLQLIQGADHRSTGADRRGSIAPAVWAPEADAPESKVLVGGGEFVDRIPGVLRVALAQGVLQPNTPGGDLYVGRRWVLFRYPAGVQKLAFVAREELAAEFSRARSLTVSENGARELASCLHEKRRLYCDAESGAWKLKARVHDASGLDILEGILVDRTFLDGALKGIDPLPSAIEFTRLVDGKPLEIEGWPAPEPKAASSPPKTPMDTGSPSPAITAASTTPSSSYSSTPAITSKPTTTTTPTTTSTSPSAPTADMAPGSHAPAGHPLSGPAPLARDVSLPGLAPVVASRKFVSPEVLFDDLRRAILDGTIPHNRWNQPCFVLPEVTYLVSPASFLRLVAKGLYSRDPRREINVYLDALSKIPAVRKGPGGRILTQIVARPGARPLWVVAVDTPGIFRSPAELSVVGFWTESPIREVGEEEARAILAARAKPGPADPAVEASHA